MAHVGTLGSHLTALYWGRHPRTSRVCAHTARVILTVVPRWLRVLHHELALLAVLCRSLFQRVLQRLACGRQCVLRGAHRALCLKLDRHTLHLHSHLIVLQFSFLKNVLKFKDLLLARQHLPLIAMLPYAHTVFRSLVDLIRLIQQVSTVI